MNAPRITNEERGITVNKSLAWTLIVGLVGAGLWLGTELTSAKTAVVNLADRQAERHAETLSYRREVEGRIRLLETARASAAADADGVRREINALRSDIRELTQLLRDIDRP